MKKYTSQLTQTLSLLIILLFPGIVFAQIQGAVRDSSNQPLSFANVMLLNQSDSSLVSGMVASEEEQKRITN